MVRLSQKEYEEILQKRGQKPKDETYKKQSSNKYRATKTWVDGICFDSKFESERYVELKLLLRAGEIAGFCRQARFLVDEGLGPELRATEYVCDFIIFHNDGTFEIEDVKGFETPIFQVKHKQFRKWYPKLILKLLKK